jgi:Aromatic-ring-opening dioxygenase LigAB, LigA subunit
MGSVDRCDKTLPLNEMLFYVRRDARLRARWNTDLEGLAREFGLGPEEYAALRDQDVRRLHEIGVHQYYVPQILRLFHGASGNTNTHPALEAYKRAYPAESAQALALAERLAASPEGRAAPAPERADRRPDRREG